MLGACGGMQGAPQDSGSGSDVVFAQGGDASADASGAPDVNPCQSGLSFCPAEPGSHVGQCVNLQTDPMNCGACGSTCVDRNSCSAGACSACIGLETLCSGICVSLGTSQNCGACSDNCGNGFCITNADGGAACAP